MNMHNNTILITGGSSGIGLALAERFLKEGNTVITCARGEERLKAAQARNPGLHIKVCDVAETKQREELAAWVLDKFPSTNVLINNAGIQNLFNVRDLDGNWENFAREIDTNLAGTIHLTMLFTDHLVRQKNAAVVTVTGGVAYTPITAAPIYGATKAGIHSFTRSLRDHFASTGIEVIEIIPPAVGGTYLGGHGLRNIGVGLDEYVDSVMEGFHQGLSEITYGLTDRVVRMSWEELEARTAEITAQIPIPAARQK